MSISPYNFSSMHMFQQLLIFLLLALGGGNAAFVFHNPPNTAPGTEHYLPGWARDNPIYQTDTQANITWNTDWTSYSIYLSQLVVGGISGHEGTEENFQVFAKDNNTAELAGFAWNVDIRSFAIENSNIFFFTAENNSTADVPVTYGIFNVTENAITSSKSGLGETTISSPPNSATSIISTSSTTTAAISTAISASPTSADASSSNPASRTSLELGLGIGLGGGLLFMSLLTVALLYQVLGNKKRNKMPRNDQYFQLGTTPSDPHQNESNSFNLYKPELLASPLPVQKVSSHNYELQG